jgi:adenosylcobinamide amidohydrolase
MAAHVRTRRPPVTARHHRAPVGAGRRARVTAVPSLEPVRGDHECDGERFGLLRWTLPAGWRAISSAPLGGGIGPCRWVLNVRVPKAYARTDLAVHLLELAGAQGCAGPGVGMLTAADVDLVERAADGGAEVAATVGILLPTWAAAPDGPSDGATADGATADGWPRPGTINVVALVPAALGDAALVNAVVTLTEAKSQAMAAAGIPGTGTASDAVCVLCPAGVPDPTDAELAFGGPRSVWGARLARATYAAVHAGARAWTGRWIPERAP